MQVFWGNIKTNKIFGLTLLIFILLSFWWLEIFFYGFKDTTQNHIFGFVYGGFSLWGGIIGLISSKAWGWHKSMIGRAIICLSLGLLLQAWGQYSFWYMNTILGIDIPYPSVPDIGYFGTIPFYIYAAYLLAKASGAKASLMTFHNRIQVILIPALMLIIAYLLFLNDIPFDFNDPIAALMDYAYPTGQALYISGALLTFSLSRKFLGGVMRFPILFLVFAFIIQFFADYIYIYFHDIYFPGSFIDYFYLAAYFVMTTGLIQLKITAENIQKN